MKYIGVVVLALACSAFGQDWNRIQVPEDFRGSPQAASRPLRQHGGPVVPTRSSVRWQISTRDLIGWQQELGTCVHKIDGERASL